MADEHARYCVTVRAQGEEASEWFDTAGDAMEAVNRLRMQRAVNLEIRDDQGGVITDRHLAMIVMEERLTAARKVSGRG